MRSEEITYQADGLTMRSRLYLPESVSGRRPGVLVFPEAFGLGEHALSRAERLAGLGYVALACDLHGNGKVYEDLGEVMPLIGALRAAPEHIARPRTARRPRSDRAARGRCGEGGGDRLLLRREHGAGAGPRRSGRRSRGRLPQRPGPSPHDAKNIKGKVLVCIGADDPGVPAEQRDGFRGGDARGPGRLAHASTAAWCTASPTRRRTPWAAPRWRAMTPARTVGPGRKCWPCSRKCSKAVEAAAYGLAPLGPACGRTRGS